LRAPYDGCLSLSEATGYTLAAAAAVWFGGERCWKPPSRLVRALRVDVEIDDFDAALLLAVPRAGTPWTIAQVNVADPGEPQALPLASRLKTALALTAELKRQRFFLSV
jgi:hypothetical protein